MVEEEGRKGEGWGGNTRVYLFFVLTSDGVCCPSGYLGRWYAKRRAAVECGEAVAKRRGSSEPVGEERALEGVLRRPGDEGRLVEAFSDKWAPNTMRRLKGKGLGPWRDFLRTRGFQEGVTPMSVFLEGRGVTDEDRLKLLSLYAMHLKDVGRVPRDYFQALQGDFSAMFKPTGLFADPRILLARSCEYRWQGRELSIKADENKKWPVTFNMIEDMFRHSWGVGYGVRETAAGKDGCMAFAAGVSMYEWGLRISETSKTASDSEYQRAGQQWAENLDHHAVRAEDFVFGAPAGEEEVPREGVMVDGDGVRWVTAAHWSSLSPSSRREQGRPTMVGLVVRTSKTNGWGQREVKYLVCKGSVGEDMLVDCLVAWAEMAEYDGPANMFFSRRAVGGKSGR